MDYNDLIAMGADVNTVVKNYGLKPGQAVMVLLLDPKEVGDIDYEMYHRTSEEHYDLEYRVNNRQLDVSFQNVLFRILSDKLDPNTIFAEKFAEYESTRGKRLKAEEKARAKENRKKKYQSWALHIRTLFQPVRSWIMSIILRFKGPGQ